MAMNIKNLFADIPETLRRELVEVLLQSDSLRVERIVSRGHVTPPGQWYDQADGEWVILLAGRAEILFAGDSEPVKLLPGDYLNIPVHKKHRVTSTAADTDTIWLAIHYGQ